MRGHVTDETELSDFVTARTAELHRAAYLLAADQERAERLVEVAVAELARRRVDIGQAGAQARSGMARLAATATTPTATPTRTDGDTASAIAGLSPRERAVLLLRSVDGFDVRSTARELGLTQAKVAAAERSASQSLGFEPLDDRMRRALTDFSERATWPDPDVTLSRARRLRPPRRHSRKRYAAAAAVLALTAAAAIGSQVQHDRWLRTPEGINASHGTHFHAYTQGYKLVGVRRVRAKGATRVDATTGEVIAPACEHFSLKSPATWARVGDASGKALGPFPCTKQSAPRYYLLALDDTYTVRAPTRGNGGLLLGRYRRVPWAKYPVVKTGFDVEHDQTLQSVLKHFGRPSAFGDTITLRGTNGVTSKVVPLPRAAPDSDLYLLGLFSPSTTGEYKITLGGQSALHCNALDTNSPWCRLYDRYVPQLQIVQIEFGVDATPHAAPPRSDRVIRVESRNASGPWTLQIHYVRIPRSG